MASARAAALCRDGDLRSRRGTVRGHSNISAANEFTESQAGSQRGQAPVGARPHRPKPARRLLRQTQPPGHRRPRDTDSRPPTRRRVRPPHSHCQRDAAFSPSEPAAAFRFPEHAADEEIELEQAPANPYQGIADGQPVVLRNDDLRMSVQAYAVSSGSEAAAAPATRASADAF